MWICLVGVAVACESPRTADKTSDPQPERDHSAAEAAREQNRIADFFAQEPVAVTAKQLINLWQTNEYAARQKYLGRPLLIDGHMDRITVEDVDGRQIPVLIFTEGGACAFTGEQMQPELAKLKKGERVILRGKPLGPTDGVILTVHCTIDSYYE